MPGERKLLQYNVSGGIGMANGIKIGVIVASLIGITLLFQNCIVKQDEQGQIKSTQDFPQTFDRITLNTGFSDEPSEQSSYIEIDFTSNTIGTSLRQFTTSGEVCDQEVELDDETKNEILAKAKAAKLCVTFLRPDPDTVCTLDLRENDYLKVFSGDKTQLDAVLFGKTCGRSGATDELCEGGPEFMALLKSLRTEILSACN